MQPIHHQSLFYRMGSFRELTCCCICRGYAARGCYKTNALRSLLTRFGKNTPKLRNNQHKHMKRIKKMWSLTFTAAASLVSVGAIQAGVVVIFSQVGNDVVATTTGSIQTAPLVNSVIWPGGHTYGGSEGLYHLYGSFGQSVSASSYWRSGGLTSDPSSSSGSDFGFYRDFLYWSGVGPNTAYTPTTSWRWTDSSMSSIGLGSLTTNPYTVWAGNYGTGNTISFAAVPEANTSILCLGALCVLGWQWVSCRWWKWGGNFEGNDKSACK